MRNVTLGIVGGGQLGRMSTIAAARLGIPVIIYTPEDNSPASQVALSTIVADYDDEQALREFSEKVDVISYEFENIPIQTVDYLSNLKPVYPEKSLLEASQDRIREKSYLNRIEIPTARWSAPETPEEALKTLEEWNASECIFKTTRFGYDGKGQARYTSDTDIETIWTQFNDAPLIMEEIVDFTDEISVIVARGKDGSMECYGPMLNEHKNHILSRTIIPAPLGKSLLDEAVKIAKSLAEQVNLIGVLTLEMFVTKDGRILANEIAPRTHNSGHWSIDACAVSQFENHVRSVCGLPLGPAKPHSACEMRNLLGDDITKIDGYLKQENTCVHDYGKQEIKPGRKMGHVTILKGSYNE